MGCGLDVDKTPTKKQLLHKKGSKKQEILRITSSKGYIIKLKYRHWLLIFDYFSITDLAHISPCCKYSISNVRMFYKISGDKKLFGKFEVKYQSKKPAAKTLSINIPRSSSPNANALTVRNGKFPSFATHLSKLIGCRVQTPPTFRELHTSKPNANVEGNINEPQFPSPQATPKFVDPGSNRQETFSYSNNEHLIA